MMAHPYLKPRVTHEPPLQTPSQPVSNPKPPPNPSIPSSSAPGGHGLHLRRRRLLRPHRVGQAPRGLPCVALRLTPPRRCEAPPLRRLRRQIRASQQARRPRRRRRKFPPLASSIVPRPLLRCLLTARFYGACTVQDDLPLVGNKAPDFEAEAVFDQEFINVRAF
jgi:hypothetical protein